uniref:IC97/Casc1 N-terminal domain-containing protein n=1 Tax=Plectus sambesii TaxID=2011161 RepID=A0A914WGS1_9BILA
MFSAESKNSYEQINAIFERKKAEAVSSFEAYWDERTWQRYVRCDRLADPHDLPAVNTFKTWLDDNIAETELHDVEDWIKNVPNWTATVHERLLDICEEKEAARLNEVLSVLIDLRTQLDEWWAVRVLRRICRYPEANERIIEQRLVSIYFWQDTVREKRAKMLFYGGLELEIASHMRNLNVALRIVAEWKANVDHIVVVLARYPPGACFVRQDFVVKPLDTNESRRPSVTISDRASLPRITPLNHRLSTSIPKQSSVRSNSRVSLISEQRRASKEFTEAKKNAAGKSLSPATSRRNKATKGKSSQSKSPSKSPSKSTSKSPSKKSKSKSPKRWDANRKPGTKKASKDVSAEVEKNEHLKASLLSKVTSLWTPSDPSATVAPSHEIDDRIECLLGYTYEIKTFAAPPLATQSGEWTLYEESDAANEAGFPGAGVAGQEFLNIGLKIPSEDIFVASGDPLVAFYDERSGKWKKGIYTTHVEHDRRSSTMKFRLSKLGKVALFQRNDFHFPFKKWAIGPSDDGSAVSFLITTDMVSLEFRLEENGVSLSVQSGAEFTKLKTINKKALSLGDMAQQLILHGVCIFPNDYTVQQHGKDNKKDTELEELVCRQIALCATFVTVGQSHLNSSLPSDSIVISSTAPERKSDLNTNEWPLYRVTKTDGHFKTIAYTLTDSTVSASLDDASEEERQERRSLVHALLNVSEDANVLSLLDNRNPALTSTVYRWLMLTRVLCMTK